MPGVYSAREPWAVAVYMVSDGPRGDKDLDKAAVGAVEDMKKAVRAAADRGIDVRVAVQMDAKTRKGSLRVLIQKGDESLEPVSLEADPIAVTTTKGRELNSGNPKSLHSFVHWFRDSSPNRRYIVHLWGHSDGTQGLFTDDGRFTSHPDTLTLPELRRAFQCAHECCGGPLDLVLFKNCWMSTLETAYQLEGLARYMVASPGLVVPFREWPYDEMFTALVPTHSSERVATDLFNTLSEFYKLAANRSNSPGERPALDEVPLSLLKLETLKPHVEPALKRLVAAFDSERHGKELRAAAERASRGDPALVDVILLCEELLDTPHDTVRDVARHLRDAIHHHLFVRPRTPRQSAFGGVSVFRFPKLEDPAFRSSHFASVTDPKDYAKLQIVETGWMPIATEGIKASEPVVA